jgi:hypothetical protein
MADEPCEFPHPHPDHPCGRKPEEPGTPCRICGEATPLDGDACPSCWKPMTTPLFKSWMASLGHDTAVEVGTDRCVLCGAARIVPDGKTRWRWAVSMATPPNCDHETLDGRS